MDFGPTDPTGTKVRVGGSAASVVRVETVHERFLGSSNGQDLPSGVIIEGGESGLTEEA